MNNSTFGQPSARFFSIFRRFVRDPFFYWFVNRFVIDFGSIFYNLLMIFRVRALTLPNLVFWRQYGGFTWSYTSEKHDFPRFFGIDFGIDCRIDFVSIFESKWLPKSTLGTTFGAQDVASGAVFRSTLATLSLTLRPTTPQNHPKSIIYSFLTDFGWIRTDVGRFWVHFGYFWATSASMFAFVRENFPKAQRDAR